MRLNVKAIGILSIAALFAPLQLPAQVSRSETRQSVFVIAVRDGSLLTLCPNEDGTRSGVSTPARSFGLQTLPIPRYYANDGDALHLIPPSSSFAPDRKILERDWRELIDNRRDMSPSGKLDPQLKSSIEKEFRRGREYSVVASAEKADLVFLVEGIYTPLTVYRSSDDRLSTYLWFWGPSWSRTADFLQALIAVALPANVYRQSPANAAALLKAQLWQGWQPWLMNQRSKQPMKIVPASSQALVADFLANKTMRPTFPLPCAAWTPRSETFSLDSAANRTAPIQMTNPSSSALAPQRDEGIPPAGKAIKVDVSFVTVPVMATDQRGKYVTDLMPSEFHLFEDEVKQNIDGIFSEAEPINVVLMMDTSGSTSLKMADIQKSALAFLEELRPHDHFMVVSFDGWIYLDSEFTSDRNQLQKAILQTRNSGGTRLYDAMDLVLAERLSHTPGRKAIVLFTDGVDTESRLAGAAETIARIEDSAVLVYVIQYNTQTGDSRRIPAQFQRVLGKTDKSEQEYAEGTRYLQRCVTSSGGQLYQAGTITNLNRAFSQIGEDLRRQYILCYYPANQKSDGSYRRIRVVVDRPGVEIRTRIGYRAQGKSPEGK
jgi:Ca-activated chloride channel family protein